MLVLFTYSALSPATFVVIELGTEQLLLDVRMFRYWPFTNSSPLIAVTNLPDKVAGL